MSLLNRIGVVVATASFSLFAVASAQAELNANPEPHVAGEAVTLQVDTYSAAKGVMPVTLAVDDGVAENTIGDSGQFIWLNRFTPDPSEFPFQLEQVSAIFGGTLVNAGDAIEIVVYSDTDGDSDPGTGAVFLAGIDETVQFNDQATFNVYDLANPVLLEGPGDVLIGIINRYGSEGFDDFPAGLDETATAGRSWAATYVAGDAPASPPLPADEQWGTIDSFGFPGNWIVRGAGTTVLPPEPIIEVPTQSHSGMIAFGLLLLLSAVIVIWRRAA